MGDYKSMKKEIEIGQIVVQRMNGIQGIVVAHKKTPHNSYYNKVVIHCFFAPYNSHLVGTQVELSFGDVIVLAS
jgi:hypothetical protein